MDVNSTCVVVVEVTLSAVMVELSAKVDVGNGWCYWIGCHNICSSKSRFISADRGIFVQVLKKISFLFF